MLQGCGNDDEQMMMILWAEGDKLHTQYKAILLLMIMVMMLQDRVRQQHTVQGYGDNNDAADDNVVDDDVTGQKETATHRAKPW